MVEFKTTKQEDEIIVKIIERAEGLGVEYDRLSLWMDISAVHSKYPIRLQEWLEADNFNFLNDVFGIIKHLNRQTGELEEFFLPRFAK